MKKKNEQHTDPKKSGIPELEIVDLENEAEEAALSSRRIPSEEDSFKEEPFKEDSFEEEPFAEEAFEEELSKEDSFEESFIEDLTPDEDVYEEIPSSDDAGDELEYLEDELEYLKSEENDVDTNGNKDENPPKKRFRINMHLILASSILLFFGLIIFRLLNWGEYINLDEIFKDGPGEYDDTLDLIIPLTGADGLPIPTNYDDGLTIVAFGNAPFADDRDSKDNLANMIADMADATVYNCSISGSYMASEWPYFSAADRPMDAYTFYWLAVLAAGIDVESNFTAAAEKLGENIPPDAEEVIRMIKSIDFSTVDVITLMYDATDYLLGHQMYNDDNDMDITRFTGNMEAGIAILQQYYPHIRIIVMGPCYAYAIDDNGEYVSSDIMRFTGEFGQQDVLSTYSIKQYGSCSSRSVTFIDHLYGTITEDNARDYLIDNLHLNKDGREMVAKRFVSALKRFDKDSK